MMTESTPAICFGRSSSVVFNAVDAPIELKPRSLSRGRSVLNKSALRRTPRDWNSQRRSTSLRVFDSDDEDDEDDGRGIMEESDGIMHPPSCAVAGLVATGRDDYDPDEASASWYKEAPRTRQPQFLRSTRYPTSSPRSREKTVVSIQQLEIEERFNRSRESAAKLLTRSSSEERAAPRAAAAIENEFASLTLESRNPPASVWGQLQDVATEIGNTFSDEEV